MMNVKSPQQCLALLVQPAKGAPSDAKAVFEEYRANLMRMMVLEASLVTPRKRVRTFVPADVFDGTITGSWHASGLKE